MVKDRELVHDILRTEDGYISNLHPRRYFWKKVVIGLVTAGFAIALFGLAVFIYVWLR